MAQQTIFLGTNANDGTGESLRGGGSMINSNFTELYALQSSTINAGAVAYAAATNHGRVQLAIDDAVLLGKTRVFVPAQYLPYTAASVTFNSSVQMVREGGDSSVYDVRAYGAAGDGVTDDAVALQAAITYAGGEKFIRLPPGTYKSSAQITISTANVSFIGDQGATIKLAASATLANGPSGLPTFLYITGANCTIGGFKLDGNKSNNTQDIAGICVASNDLKMADINVFNCQGSVALGAGIRLQDVIRARLSNIYVHDNGSNGLHVFGACSYITAGNIIVHDNGIIGMEIEGSGANRPTNILVSNLISQNNIGQNLLIKLCDDVVVSGLATLAGGNNGNVKIIYSRRVVIGHFLIRDAMVGAAAPHGIWIHQEASPGGASQDITLGPGIISSMGDGATRGDGIRLTDAVDNLLVMGVESIDGTGYGFAVDNSTYTPTNVQIVMSDFSGNSLGAFDSWTAIGGTRHMIGCTPGVSAFFQQSVDLTGGSVLQVSDIQVVGARGAAVADATDAASVITQLNALLARCRAHGLIAT